MIECLKDFYTLDNIFNTSNNTVHKFNNFIGRNNYERIHPVKQRKVYEIVNLLLKDNVGKYITDIIVFGSATTLFCSSFSDIDIIVLGDFSEFYPTVDLYQFGEVDLFGYNKQVFLTDMENNNFYKNAWEKGVKVYEQLSASS
ncbi:nucleotidyltransferase domain-containing protein [Clostridium sp.]|uniref:nucleotidyltransferase domain-containing protein n=1 Tax=Clostridium sp. TaxID=1506 RepID=UPI003D6D55F7